MTDITKLLVVFKVCTCYKKVSQIRAGGKAGKAYFRLGLGTASCQIRKLERPEVESHGWASQSLLPQPFQTRPSFHGISPPPVKNIQ